MCWLMFSFSGDKSLSSLFVGPCTCQGGGGGGRYCRLVYLASLYRLQVHPEHKPWYVGQLTSLRGHRARWDMCLAR